MSLLFFYDLTCGYLKNNLYQLMSCTQDDLVMLQPCSVREI